MAIVGIAGILRSLCSACLIMFITVPDLEWCGMRLLMRLASCDFRDIDSVMTEMT